MSSYSYSAGYRSDIEGLRALAVLSVVLFHAGVTGFGGGYVGIDVFFVISGYLLTGHVLSRLYQQNFSFRDFYARRAWRILPALTGVICLSLIASAYLLMPEAFADAGVAAQRAAYFAVNHYFSGNENDYWDQVALRTQPLLHLWSLAVGAQFILVLPCLMMLLFRVSRRSDIINPGSFLPPPMWVVRSVLIGITLISFAISSMQVQSDQTAAFYLLPSRVWEFLLGGIIASFAGSRVSRPPLLLAEICSIVGLMGILWGVLTYSPATPFPGEYALAPVLGAGLILYSGYSRSPTLITRLLSLRALVFVGLISYSLFLWHWPLLVFLRSTVWSVNGWPDIPVVGYLVITFVVSVVSWRLIERPFQTGYLATAKPRVIVGAVLIMAIACVIAGLQVGRTDQQSLPPVLTQLDRDMSVPPGIACEGKPELDVIRAGQSGCKLGDPATLAPSATPDFILLGDSHARMWVQAFDKASRDLGINGVAMAYSNCAPLRGAMPSVRAECVHITEAALDYAARSPIQQVILAANWVAAAESAFPPPVPGVAPAPLSTLSASLQETIRYLQQAGKAVTLILDVPHLDNDDVPRDQALLSVSQQGADAYGPSRAAHMARQEPILKSLEAVWPKVKPFGIVDPTVELCGTGNCLVARHGRTWYGNKHQLTDDAANGLRTVFFPLLRSVAAPR